MYHDVPADKAEILKRINDADSILLGYTTILTKEVLQHC